MSWSERGPVAAHEHRVLYDDERGLKVIVTFNDDAGDGKIEHHLSISHETRYPTKDEINEALKMVSAVGSGGITACYKFFPDASRLGFHVWWK